METHILSIVGVIAEMKPDKTRLPSITCLSFVAASSTNRNNEYIIEFRSL